MARRLAAENSDGTARTGDGFRQEFDQGFICGGIDGRGGDFYFKFVAKNLADSIFGGAGLDFDRKNHAFRPNLNERRRLQLFEFLPGIINGG